MTTPASTGMPEAFARIAGRVAELSGDRAGAAAAAEEALAPLRPTEPAWFLATVAVDPDRQGSGLGGAVLGPGLGEAGEAGYRHISRRRRSGTSRSTVGSGSPSSARWICPATGRVYGR